MKKILRIILIGFEFFVALTAIGGGIAILTGKDKFPLEWLEGSLFSTYTIPALLLLIIVGGSALGAAISLLANHIYSQFISLLSGLFLLGYIVIEVIILKQIPPGPTPIEIFYLVLGILITGLALLYRKKT
ncbi:MAG: hypothetical protein A2X13_12510 [Bacteroidetes bacterium GWC2_33_15]|nr:MAG: hypothetical protein A2X10_14185 [Bacteroidetes bacterium GWA2_33_15]OFX50612.1 MAG: hypothetical protein A2X13_12510 [Bacteroidetes bacterium GWC2_33_15]OFX64149.1 MAG: hypothetical protein A2X15_02960 [Bacteroidetes bacterium GWB2_32_14]OFX69761.1 MAG: hypothetical protein A2X14_05185 [Bacteroidetes bacterium GWD2_33_33]HAN19798.1 hypothetical protein [Bacteroidales bacterium]